MARSAYLVECLCLAPATIILAPIGVTALAMSAIIMLGSMVTTAPHGEGPRLLWDTLLLAVLVGVALLGLVAAWISVLAETPIARRLLAFRKSLQLSLLAGVLAVSWLLVQATKNTTSVLQFASLCAIAGPALAVEIRRLYLAMASTHTHEAPHAG